MFTKSEIAELNVKLSHRANKPVELSTAVVQELLEMSELSFAALLDRNLLGKESLPQIDNSGIAERGDLMSFSPCYFNNNRN